MVISNKRKSMKKLNKTKLSKKVKKYRLKNKKIKVGGAQELPIDDNYDIISLNNIREDYKDADHMWSVLAEKPVNDMSSINNKDIYLLTNKKYGYQSFITKGKFVEYTVDKINNILSDNDYQIYFLKPELVIGLIENNLLNSKYWPTNENNHINL
jgi:hypothetical protein